MTRADGVRSSLSLRRKLFLSFVLLAVVAIAAVSIPIATLTARRATQQLRERAVRYARLLAPQLRAVVAFNDRMTAREIFSAFSADSDVDGLAVYDARGALIEGRGLHPEVLLNGRPSEEPAPAHLTVFAPIVAPDGVRGSLLLSVTTDAVDQQTRQTLVTTLGIAAVALIAAVVLSTLLSRGVSRRISTIAAAAERIAAGAFEHPDLVPGANDDIGTLASAFNRMVDRLRSQFVEREQLASTEQARLEDLVSERTHELRDSREEFRLIAESTKAVPFAFSLAERRFTYVGPQGHALLGVAVDEWKREGFLENMEDGCRDSTVGRRFAEATSGGEFEFESPARHADGRSLHLRWVVSAEASSGTDRSLRGLVLDLTEKHQLERELAQAQKLESVGRLAAGIAHEINTPVQFVSDSLFFLRDASAELFRVVESLEAVREAVATGKPAASAAAAALDAEEEADLPYLVEQVPRAFERSMDGLQRVASIVRSMKEFAHPDQKEMIAVDLNRSIQSTLIVARTEYKYVADLETDLGELPPVMCFAGEINQAVLNIVTNAAHAIGDVAGDNGPKGLITVRTRCEGNEVVVQITDTGGGIPAWVADRIFDPFFTTKAVGKGTGQGLAIARAVIVEKHRGQLRFDTTPGKGTTFTISLPVDQSQELLAISA